MHDTLPNLATDASRAPTETIQRPPTSEMRAFAGMTAEPGCKPRTRAVHDQLMAAVTSEPVNCISSSPDMLDILASAAKAMEAWHLELIRLIQAGMTREQLVALLQWSAIQWAKDQAELRSLAADDRAEARRKDNLYFGMGVEAMLDQRADALGDDMRERISTTCELIKDDNETGLA